MIIRTLFTIFCLLAFSIISHASDLFNQNLTTATPTSRGLAFSVQGSNTVGAALMKNFLKDFLSLHGALDIEVVNLPTENEYRVQGKIENENVFFDVAAHGSSTGFRGLASGTADVSMSSRRIRNSEVETLASLGNLRSFDSEHIIAIDGLAVIVNSNNPVNSLLLDQVADIFSGKISNWQELGGSDKTISIYARDENSGTWDTFESLVLDDDHPLSASAQRFESNDLLSDSVANDVAGIGFVGLASVRNSKAIAISEPGAALLKPETLVIATEDYPLARRLYFYTPTKTENKWIQQFAAFVQTERAQKIVSETGFVAQNVLKSPVDYSHISEERMQEYLGLVAASDRLSVNIRFAEGSADLDNKAKHDINRLVDFMLTPENTGKRLLLIGFGDPLKTEKRTDLLSEMRALRVKGELLRRGISAEKVYGFGADHPIAANQGNNSAKNRRVEVWMRQQ